MKPTTRRLPKGDDTKEVLGTILEHNDATGAVAYTGGTTVWEDRGRRYARSPVVIVRRPGQFDTMMDYGSTERNEAEAKKLVRTWRPS